MLKEGEGPGHPKGQPSQAAAIGVRALPLHPPLIEGPPLLHLCVGLHRNPVLEYHISVHMYACVMVCAVSLTPGLEEVQCVPAALSLDVPQLQHARGEQALLDPSPVVHVELQLQVGHVEEVLHVVVVVFLGTDVKVTGGTGTQ